MQSDAMEILAAIRSESLRTGRHICKSNRVIEAIAKARGEYGLGIEEALWNECEWEDPTLHRIYAQIIALVRQKRWVDGQGNFGGASLPPAHPKVTECWLTEAGLQALLDHHPIAMIEPKNNCDLER